MAVEFTIFNKAVVGIIAPTPSGLSRLIVDAMQNKVKGSKVVYLCVRALKLYVSATIET